MTPSAHASMAGGAMDPPMAAHRLHYPAKLAVWLCFALSMSAMALAVLIEQGFPLDDSWIHQVVGRNAARYGIPGFMPGQPSSGSSSAMWPWLIAINHGLLPEVAPYVFLLLINVAAMAGITWILHRAVRQDGLGTPDSLSLVALPLLYGNLVWLTATGMEHLLFVFFTLASGLLACRPRTTPSTLATAGLLMGLAVATRPEGITLAAGCMLLIYVRERRIGAVLAFAGPLALLVLATVLNNLYTSRSPLPVTVAGRQWLYFGTDPVVSMAHLMGFLRAVAGQITKGLTQIPQAHTLGAVLVGLMAMGVWRLWRQRAWTVLFLVALAVVNLLTYGLMLPTIGHGMRYQSLALVFVLPLIAQGSLCLVDGLRHWQPALQPHTGALQATAMLSVLLLGLFSLSAWTRITHEGIRHINDTHVRMARWIATHIDPAETVATFDLGAIGYFGQAHVIDLGGLVDPDFVPYMYQGRTQAYLRERGVHLLVLPTETPRDSALAPCGELASRLGVCDAPGFRKTKLAEAFSEPAPWADSYALTTHATRGQTIYRIDW